MTHTPFWPPSTTPLVSVCTCLLICPLNMDVTHYFTLFCNDRIVGRPQGERVSPSEPLNNSMWPELTSFSFYWQCAVYVWGNLHCASDRGMLTSVVERFRCGCRPVCVCVWPGHMGMEEYCYAYALLAWRKEAVEVGSRKKEKDMLLLHWVWRRSEVSFLSRRLWVITPETHFCSHHSFWKGNICVPVLGVCMPFHSRIAKLLAHIWDISRTRVTYSD